VKCYYYCCHRHRRRQKKNTCGESFIPMKLTTRTREREKHDHRLLVKVAASSSHTRERREKKQKHHRGILKKKNMVVVMCNNSTLVNSTTGLASASAILDVRARVVLCVFLLSFVFSSPFFCVPFLFRVLVNPKRFFFLLFCPFFRSTSFHTKVLTYFCKDDDARRRRRGRERDAVESSR